jgi:hypothetical protein|tara:strand:- start:2703 stop:2816 length:114 start_codon:yes stop_codon:yes gene_type:complete
MVELSAGASIAVSTYGIPAGEDGMMMTGLIIYIHSSE